MHAVAAQRGGPAWAPPGPAPRDRRPVAFRLLCSIVLVQREHDSVG